MLNFELARIIQADREREIQAEVRTRQLLAAFRCIADTDDSRQPRPSMRQDQRPASSGVLSR